METHSQSYQFAQLRHLHIQVSSVEEADARIDQLAKTGKLDPAMMLTMTKAYAAAKDTDYTKEQVKDVMAHLYHKVPVILHCRTLDIRASLHCFPLNRLSNPCLPSIKSTFDKVIGSNSTNLMCWVLNAGKGILCSPAASLRQDSEAPAVD